MIWVFPAGSLWFPSGRNFFEKFQKWPEITENKPAPILEKFDAGFSVFRLLQQLHRLPQQLMQKKSANIDVTWDDIVNK